MLSLPSLCGKGATPKLTSLLYVFIELAGQEDGAVDHGGLALANSGQAPVGAVGRGRVGLRAALVDELLEEVQRLDVLGAS